MNGGVAHRARLVLSGLVVRWTLRTLRGEGVALEAEQVHLAYPQETGICGAMRRVTTGAAFGFHRHVFIDERPLFVGMAFEANLVSIGKCPDLAKGGRAMGIVAVAALHQAFVDAVVIGLAKVSLGSRVTAVAQSGLCLNQQVFRFLGVVR